MSVADLSLMAAGGDVCSGLRRRDVSLMVAGGDVLRIGRKWLRVAMSVADYADAIVR